MLQRILSEAELRGGTGFIRGQWECVCFSEAPLSEFAGFLRANEVVQEFSGQRPRYEPFGIAVPKIEIWRAGGMPVIYQGDEYYSRLSDSMKYRHVRLDLDRGIDLTWEREWRLRAKSFPLNPDTAIVLVRSESDARILVSKHDDNIQLLTAGVGDASALGVNSFPWHVVPLSVL